MKVECVANTGEALPQSYIDPEFSLRRERKFHITIGETYTVYAIVTDRNKIWYYIADDVYVDYPALHPAPLFKITDNKTSSCWKAKYDSEYDSLLLAFEEWVSNQYFMDRLTDGNEAQVKIFARMKEIMDAE